MEDNHRLALEMIKYEPEFKEGGFVYTHIKQGKSDPLVAIKSAVDRMTDLYDVEHSHQLREVHIHKHSDEQLPHPT